MYTGTYKVVKKYRNSSRVEVIKRGLSLEKAQDLVSSFPNSNSYIVCFYKQFTAKKYFNHV